MRYLLVIGALAFLLAGTSALALADPAPSLQSTSQAASASSALAESLNAVDSPEVTQWTGVAPHPARAHSGHRDIAKFASRLFTRTAKIANALTRSALRFLGTPYVFGGESAYGFDCSGFTQHVFAMLGISIPRTADAQYYAGHRAVGGARPGDLVFFQTYVPGPSHVGIYLGNGHFVHASSHGVKVSSLSESYWSARYLGVRRMFTVH